MSDLIGPKIAKNIPAEDAELESLASEYANSFTKFTDLEGIVIRGHILVEQALNRSIELTVLNKSEYKAEKFSFSHKIQIATMLNIGHEFKVELNAINKLRNQIAHSLKFDEKYIDQIVDGVYKKESAVFKNKDDKTHSLITAISFMCGAISYSYKNARMELLLKHLHPLTEPQK